ncbi:hypothetical protein L195_g057677, partial [Trifolium pratense]
ATRRFAARPRSLTARQLRCWLCFRSLPARYSEHARQLFATCSLQRTCSPVARYLLAKRPCSPAAR